MPHNMTCIHTKKNITWNSHKIKLDGFLYDIKIFEIQKIFNLIKFFQFRYKYHTISEKKMTIE